MIVASFSKAGAAALVAGCLCVSGLAVAADAAGAAAKAQQLETVVVTGTRVLGRTLAESLAPVDVLTAQDLRATGAPSLNVALRILLPSFNFPVPSILGATDATMPAQLRGLSPDHTLVLINGKRQHTTATVNVAGWFMGRGSSPVDLNAIPMNAIARIEVLRDGAAAQYGSDAIAGVINIILKGGDAGGSFSISRGQHDGGQGKTWQAGVSDAFHLGDDGWLRVSAAWLDQDPTNQAQPDYRFPGDPAYGTVTFHYGLPKTRSRQLVLNGEYRLGEHATLYGFSLFNQREVASGVFFRAWTQYAPTNPAAVAVYPAGFRPLLQSDIRDDTEVLGLRGKWGAWHYDVSASTGGSHWKLHNSRSFNFSLGAASPTRVYNGTLTLRQNIFNADFSRALDIGTHSPLTLAWGLAYRHEEFTIKPGERASWIGSGAEGFAGYRPLDAGSHDRSNFAQYLDLEVGLSAKLTAGLALRHEHYSDFGNATSWKLSGRYQFTPALALRATASTGFRAPSLQQQYYSSTTTDSVPNPETGALELYRIRTFPVSAPAAIALGAQPLKAETSRNYSVGLVFTPAVGPYVTLDLYQVDIDVRILLSGDLVGQAVRQYLSSVGIPYVEGGRFFTNAVATRTRGADLVAVWPLHLGQARLTLTGGYNYNDTEIRSVKPNPPQLALQGLELPIITRQQRGLLTEATPSTKAFVAAHWQRGHWGLRLRATRYGSFTDRSSTAIADQTFGARVILGASLHYARGGWTLALGGNNIANTYPQRNNDYNNFAGMLNYHFLSPFGFNGAYWYANAGYRW